MAEIPGSVPVTGFIAPTDSTDTYATHDSLYGRGGLREVDDQTARDAIPADRRKVGMLVYTHADGVYWRLLSGPWTYGPSDWAAWSTGGGGGTYTHVQVSASTTWTINHPLGGYPSVVVIDGSGDEVQGTVQYVTTSQVVLTFAYPISGTAQLN